MASTTDFVPITAAMLALSYVKPAITFTTVAGKATTTEVYLPATLPERAGARGVGTAVTTDANWTFAISGEGPAVECTPTLILPTVV